MDKQWQRKPEEEYWPDVLYGAPVAAYVVDGALIASIQAVVKAMGESHPASFPDYWYLAGGHWAEIFEGRYMAPIEEVSEEAYGKFTRVITPKGYKYQSTSRPLPSLKVIQPSTRVIL
jgi:hypothetical protein